MTRRDQLIAYLATLGALVLVFTIAVGAGLIEPDVIGKIEAFGLGTITGGLIRSLRMPEPRGTEPDIPQRKEPE